MAYEDRGETTSLYISYMVYMIITQTKCTIVLLLAVISKESRRHRPGKKSQACAERKNPIRSDGAYTCRSNVIDQITCVM